MSVIGKVLLQVFGVAAYFALVILLYWRRLKDAGAVAVIVGLLFLFKSVVDSGAISIAHLSPSDPEFNIGAPGVELAKALSFFGVGVGAWIDLAKAMETGVLPANVPSAVIHLTLDAASPFVSPVAALDIRRR
jgi:hypothetical protein